MFPAVDPEEEEVLVLLQVAVPVVEELELPEVQVAVPAVSVAAADQHAQLSNTR